MSQAFKKQPLEFYGQSILTNREQIKAAFIGEQCPFLQRRCVKQRKSNANQTIGSCTVGYQNHPLIICPYRFISGNTIFRNIIPLLKPNLAYATVPEVTMPGGNIDYFLIGTNNGTIEDYAGVEIQSLDTTGSGTIWQAREDLANGALQDAYAYGINWKMSAKTILMQLHHKALAFEALRKKLILVIQAAFFDYISHEFQTDQVHDAQDADPLHFHIYDLRPEADTLALSLVARKSTDIRGVERMLTLGRASQILEEDILGRLQGKMSQASHL